MENPLTREHSQVSAARWKSTQVELTQSLPAPQALPHAPQLTESYLVLTQVSPQAVRPWLQVSATGPPPAPPEPGTTHAPSAQIWPS